MIIFPAIDMKDNKCVRLNQGKFDKIKVYGDDPIEMAKYWESQGAEYLHLVDLDGAKNESIVNRKTIERIVNAIQIPIQLGGGIRTAERVRQLLELGINRAILGTIAITDFPLVEKIAADYRDFLAVSVDAIDGKAATHGWQINTDTTVLSVCRDMERVGIHTLVYTDITRDGMMTGPNFDAYQKLAEETKLDIIASGGISTVSDVIKLKKLNLYGAIIGKALYESQIQLKEVL